MVDHKVKKGEAVWLDTEAEIFITKVIRDIVKEDDLRVLAYNICGDHVHMVLVCDVKDLSNIVRKLKGKSAQKYKEFLKVPKDEKFHLWAQKFNDSVIEDDEKLRNAVEYVEENREKHELSVNKGLQPLVQMDEGMVCDIDMAFSPQYEGGFDVVLGNPPYGAEMEIEGAETNESYLLTLLPNCYPIKK